MSDDTDLLTDALPPAAAAFLGSDAHTFAGKPLEPFSIRRQYAAQAMGNRLLGGKARFDDPVPCRRCGGPQFHVNARTGEAATAVPNCPACGGTGQIHGSYDGMFSDVAALLYLCTCPKAEVLAAFSSPAAVLDRALDWAERQQIAIGSARHAEACAVYHAILADLQRSQFTVGDGGGAEPPNG